MSSQKVIKQFDSAMEAEIVRSLLKSSGIESFVDNQVIGNVLPHLSQAIGGFRLSVASEDEKRALEVLSSNLKTSDNSTSLKGTLIEKVTSGENNDLIGSEGTIGRKKFFIYYASIAVFIYGSAKIIEGLDFSPNSEMKSLCYIVVVAISLYVLYGIVARRLRDIRGNTNRMRVITSIILSIIPYLGVLVWVYWLFMPKNQVIIQQVEQDKDLKRARLGCKLSLTFYFLVSFFYLKGVYVDAVRKAGSDTISLTAFLYSTLAVIWLAPIIAPIGLFSSIITIKRKNFLIGYMTLALSLLFIGIRIFLFING